MLPLSGKVRIKFQTWDQFFDGNHPERYLGNVDVELTVVVGQ